MSNKPTIYSVASSRFLFFQDIEATNEYLKEMKKYVTGLCKKEGLRIPRGGRGLRCLQPNFAYAMHYRLKGVSAHVAAEHYFVAEKKNFIAAPGASA